MREHHPLSKIFMTFIHVDLFDQSECYAFADPYVEHDALTLWIDLILLKRDVYRHLLFNRGAGARRLTTAQESASDVGKASLLDIERRMEKVSTAALRGTRGLECLMKHAEAMGPSLSSWVSSRCYRCMYVPSLRSKSDLN